MQKRNLREKSVKPEIREHRFPHVSFHPAAGANSRPFGAPPSNGRRENAAHRRLPHMGRVAIGEYPFSPLSSFRANARNLFRSRSGKMRGQRKTGSTVFLKTCNHGVSRKLIHAGNRKRQTANEKDPSAPLGMTIRECAFLTFLFIPLRKPTSAPSGHLLPTEGGRMPPTAAFPIWGEWR